MAARVTVLVGTALCGKTARAVDRYCAAKWSANGVLRRRLWLSPNHRAVLQVRSRLLARVGRAMLSPGIFTFAQFAEQVVQASSVRVRAIEPYQTRQILRHLVDEAHLRGELTHFQPIAKTEGLLDLLGEAIGDLKRQEVWPDEFAAACDKVGNSPKSRDLLLLYERYQQFLHTHSLYDAEGRFWSARARLREGQSKPFERLQLVVVDGFTDFTRTQHEILQILSERVDEVVITLLGENRGSPPGSDGTDPDRDELFHKPLATLAELRRRHDHLIVEHLPPPGRWESRPGEQDCAGYLESWRHLERSLFSDPRAVVSRNDSAGIEVLSAPSRVGEVELLARRIKALLVHGDADSTQKPVLPQQIVVVFRSLRDMAPLIREVFAEYGIPAVVDCGLALERSPAFSSLLALLRLRKEDWPFRQLLAVLSNNFFRPDWAEWEGGRALVPCEAVVRRLQIPAGRQALCRAVERRIAGLRSGKASAQPSAGEQLQEAETALRLLERLGKTLELLPERADAVEWLRALENFVAEVGWLKADAVPGHDFVMSNGQRLGDDEPTAWSVLKQGLESTIALDGLLHGRQPEISLEEFVERLRFLGRSLPLPRDSDETGRVRVLSAPDARGLDAPYFFVAGLSEKAFPPAASDSNVYSLGEYRELNASGLRFVDRRERTCEEMLLYYEVVARPARRLFLSYPALDNAAQPLSPSPFLRETTQLFSSLDLRNTPAPSLSPIPSDESPLGPRDLRVLAVARSMTEDGALLAGMIREPRRAADPGPCQSVGNLLAGVELILDRSRPPYGAFDGVLLGPAARARLAEDYGPEHCWSTSQLEQYAYCPHQFFLQRVLRLRELSELTLAIDHGRRGERMHSLLAAAHRRWSADGNLRSPCDGDPSEFARLCSGILDGVLEQSRDESPLSAAFAELDRRLIEQWIASYLQQHLAYEAAFEGASFTQTPVASHFEVSFGPQPGGEAEDAADPLSTAAPYELSVNGTTLKLSGRIDRIDVGLLGGQVVFNLLDYKTGAPNRVSAQDFESGVALQLPLYALAVQEFLLAERGALSWQPGYWFFKKNGFHSLKELQMHQLSDGRVQESPAWAKLKPKLLARIADLVAGVRSALFPMACSDEECASRCSYGTVCRVNAARALGKVWPPASSAVEEPSST